MPDSRETLSSAPSARLLRLLTDVPHLNTFLDQVVNLAAAIDPPAYVGLTVQGPQPFTLVSSDSLAARLDEVQYDHDQGPCLDSVRHGVVVQVDDINREFRWHNYQAHAIAQGVMSSLSIPVDVDGQTVASLNIYSRRPAAFTGTPRRHAEAFAGQCAAALALTLHLTDQTQTPPGPAAGGSGTALDASAYSRDAALRAAQLRREATEIRRRVAASSERAHERITRFSIRATDLKIQQSPAQPKVDDAEG